MLRGVKIGEVTRIALRLGGADLVVQIPVYVSIDPSRIANFGDEQPAPYAHYQNLIDKGMRAQLASQSFVTGMLMVTLDFYPDEPAKLVGADKDVREIPTIPSDMEKLQKTLADLPLEEMVRKLDNVVSGIEKMVTSPELSGAVASMKHLVENTDKLVTDVRAELPSLTGSLKSTAGAADSTLAAAERAFAELDQRLEGVASDFREVARAAQGALSQAEKTLAMKEGVPGQIATGLIDTMAKARSGLNAGEQALLELKGLVGDGSELSLQVGRTLEEFRGLSRSIRALTEYLQRHPEALLRGKEGD
jgi:paraquat-inducible protein B